MLCKELTTLVLLIVMRAKIVADREIQLCVYLPLFLCDSDKSHVISAKFVISEINNFITTTLLFVFRGCKSYTQYVKYSGIGMRCVYVCILNER